MMKCMAVFLFLFLGNASENIGVVQSPEAFPQSHQSLSTKPNQESSAVEAPSSAGPVHLPLVHLVHFMFCSLYNEGLS